MSESAWKRLGAALATPGPFNPGETNNVMETQLARNADILLDIFNYLGIFVFAISGAAAGIRKHADLFGIAVLAFAASCCGGILRDVLIGALPPENIRAWQPVVTSFAAAAATIAFYPYLAERFNNPVQVFDAFGLGLFSVLGAEKALFFGIGPIWAVFLGMITAVGGGMVRDILLANVPQVLRNEVYATASLAGAGIAVAGQIWPVVPTHYTMILGAVVCIVWRCLAIRYKWHIPKPRFAHPQN